MVLSCVYVNYTGQRMSGNRNVKTRTSGHNVPQYGPHTMTLNVKREGEYRVSIEIRSHRG